MEQAGGSQGLVSTGKTIKHYDTKQDARGLPLRQVCFLSVYAIGVWVVSLPHFVIIVIVTGITNRQGMYYFACGELL